MELNKDFREFIESLNVNKVQYLVVGGYAVNFHGYPRYTKDIDFWIWIEPDNIKRLMQAIEDFGFSFSNLTERDFSNPGMIVQLGYEPYRIDLMVDVEGMDFEKCFNNKIQSAHDGTLVNFIGLGDLVLAKRIAGRLQDLADAEKLVLIQQKQKKKD